MAENDPTNPPANDPPKNDPPIPTVIPPANPPANSNGDLGSLATLIAAIPERVAHAVRESMPAPTPPADPPKNDPPKNDPPAHPVEDEKPGKSKARVTFFGIPWS